MKICTDDLNEARRNALDALQRLFAFVKLAFKNDLARRRSFGTDRYRSAMSNQGHLLQLLRLAHTQATFNSAALEAVGYTAAQIAALATLADALEAAKTAQLNAQSAQKVGTDAYYDILNTMWDYMQELATVRQFIFPEDAAKQMLYLLYPKGYRRQKRGKTVVEGSGEVVEREEVEKVKG